MPAETEIRACVQAAARRLVSALDRCNALLQQGNDQTAQTEVTAALDECLLDLARLEIWGAANRLPSSELWKIAGHYLERGWMEYRAREKPRGYAGDYELLSRMYLEQPCDDPLGRLLDRYFLNEAAPVAVRHRMQMMADWIVAAAGCESLLPNLLASPHACPLPGGEGERARPLKIALFGSAFGLEIRDALQRLPESIRREIQIVLLDLDPAAIEFACGQLAPLIATEQLTALATNLFRLPERPAAAAALHNSDLIFCPGIFDYLVDDPACAMLRFLYSQLAPGGALTVFQFAPHCSSRALMEWIGNWYLLYRDAAEFRRLVASAGFGAGAAHFAAEPLGVDLFVTLTRDLAN